MCEELRKRLCIKSRGTAREVIDGLEGRDVCMNCGSQGGIEVHHIDGDWLNNHPLNLIPICHSCHRIVHGQQAMMGRLAEMREEAARLSS